MTTSRIGSRTRFFRHQVSQSGISLVEALVAVVILLVGIVAVYQPMLKSLIILEDMEDRLEVSRLASDELWLLKNNAARLKTLAAGKKEESQLMGVQRVYHYVIQTLPLSSDKILNRMDILLQWKSSGHAKKMMQTRYVETPLPS